MMNAPLSRPGRAWFALVLAAGLVPSARGAAAEPPAVARLLPERTLALVVVEDISRTLEGLCETSPGRLWADPEFQAFASPMREHLGKLYDEAAANVPVAPAHVLPLLEGQMAFAVLKPPRVGGMPDLFPELVAAVDVSDAAAAARLLDLAAAGLEAKGLDSRTWEEGDARFMHLPMPRAPFEGNIVVVGGRLLATVSPDATLIRGMIAESRGEGDGRTLARDADFLKAVERAGRRRELFAYLVARAAEAFFEMLRLYALPEEFMKARLVYEALGLDGVRSVSLSAAIDPPGFRTGVFVHAPAPRKGIFTLFSEKPMRPSMLGAAPGRARGLLSWSVRPDRVPDLVREVAAAVGPDEAARAEGPMTAVEQQLALIGDFGHEGVLFVERAAVEPVVELSSVVVAFRTGKREVLEPLYRLVAGLASVAATGRGLGMQEETTPEGDLVRTLELPLGFSPTVALSDDFIVASPTRDAAMRALARLSAAVGADAEDVEPLVGTPACRDAIARVGKPTFLFAYRRAWRAEDYAPMMALMPALAGVAYGAAVRVDVPPEVLELIGKINVPAMPSPELLAKYSIPAVVAGRADADGVSVFGWGPGLYPGGLGSPESVAFLAAPAVVAAIIVDRAGEAAIKEVLQIEAEPVEDGVEGFRRVTREELEAIIEEEPFDEVEW
ncbi:MAG: hypothetical protein ACYTKD_13455 [Planctomycetota bacterium]|jgi:hypothetical protein